ncbi:NEAT domain-containing protein [Secundilactobacillus folii]|nr:NEAT domain-containing protein [Secundilactobacillus folii]
MKLYGLKKVVGEGLVTVSVILGVGVIGQINADASKYQDGTYQVPVHILKKGTSESSLAQQFFNSSASATVANDDANMSLGVNASGQPYMKGTQVDGQNALSADSSSLNYQVPVGTDKSNVDFELNTPIGSMNQSADFQYDWSGVPLATQTTQTTTTGTNNVDTGNQTQTNGQGSTTSTGQQNVTTSSTSTAASSATSTPTATTVAGSTSQKKQSTSQNVSHVNYQVLQADGSSKSEASQYYTHIADIQKLSNGTYKVTMHVSYGKNTGMDPKGFVPLTVNGVNVSDVQYGSTSSNYTNSFSFVVPSLKALNQGLVKGTIHVSVPFMHISQDFTVNYAFAATSDTGASNQNQGQSSATPTATSQKKTAENQKPSVATKLSSGAKKVTAAKTAYPTAQNNGSANSSVTTQGTGVNAYESATTNGLKTPATHSKYATGKLPQTSENESISAVAVGLTSLSLLLGTLILKKKES